MDRFLGPYPHESWKKWISLTQHVEETELKWMILLSAFIHHQNSNTASTGLSNITGASQTAPHSTTNPIRPPAHYLTHFTAPPHPQLPEMKPREGTIFCFTQPPHQNLQRGGLVKPDSLVAELQVAFVSFLVAQVWDGWDQWRCVEEHLCQAEVLLLEGLQLCAKLLLSNNFLASALNALFTNIKDNSANLPWSLRLSTSRTTSLPSSSGI
ncbi:protein AAR2 homolog [Scylla paramamosain]|uniref:protein AAR2 homolog n=1 Tax=Scylla paramamosain TaxID=85552 RepID=UPI003083254A